MPPSAAAGAAVAYFHGFASSPLSTKGVHLASVFADLEVPFYRPDLNRPSFARLTYDGALEAIDAMAADHPQTTRWRFVGSSMGGYLAARWMELHPGVVDRAVLLCPAFDLVGRWPAIVGREAMSFWEESGSLVIPDATGTPTPVHWGLVESAARHPRFPEVSCPTLIIHGRRDEVVPIEASRDYARQHSALVTLVEVDDEHPLGDSIDFITAETRRFFELE